MKIRLVGSSAGDGGGHQFLMSYVVNDVVAFDAGGIGFAIPLDAQRAIEHVFLSHSHIDHIASLPSFVENVSSADTSGPVVYGSAETLDCVRTHIFNDQVWPDLQRLSHGETSFLTMTPFDCTTALEVAGIRVLPVELDHLVPTVGFLIDDGETAVAIVSDTGPTDAIWRLANQIPHLKAIFLEATFPDSMAWLAEKSKHLTPALFAAEVAKLDADIPVIAIHIKPAFHADVVNELEALRLPQLEIGVPGNEYRID